MEEGDEKIANEGIKDDAKEGIKIDKTQIE